MRVKRNPFKNFNIIEAESDTLIIFKVFIPFLQDYYLEKFEVLKISLNSLLSSLQFESKYELLIVMHGCCFEVEQYILNTSRIYGFDFLRCQSNLGVNGAMNAGYYYSNNKHKFLAFLDEDVFFKQGWLYESIKILKANSNIGLVTPVLTSSKIYLNNSYTHDWLISNKINYKTNQWQDKWDYLFSSSIGDLGNLNSCNPKKYSIKDVEFFPCHSHCAFVATKESLKVVFPFKTGQAMASISGDKDFDMNLTIDKKLNDHYFLKVSTSIPYAFHNGNTISSLTNDLIQLCNLNIKTNQKENKFVKLPKFIMKFIFWLNNKTFVAIKKYYD